MAIKKVREFKQGTVKAYMEHMRKLHGNSLIVNRFAIEQIYLVRAGVTDSRLGDDAIILLTGIKE